MLLSEKFAYLLKRWFQKEYALEYEFQISKPEWKIKPHQK